MGKHCMTTSFSLFLLFIVHVCATNTPSVSPSVVATNTPTNAPSNAPSVSPSVVATNTPTNAPSNAPSATPTNALTTNDQSTASANFMIDLIGLNHWDNNTADFFKETIAKRAGKLCGLSVLKKCTNEDIHITGAASRTTTVNYRMLMMSQMVAELAALKLEDYMNSTIFIEHLIAKSTGFENVTNVHVKSVTITSDIPDTDNASDSISSMSKVIALIVLGALVITICIILCCCYCSKGREVNAECAERNESHYTSINMGGFIF